MDPMQPQDALKRLLANGPLTGWPRRPADQDLLVALTGARFEVGRDYREDEVNEIVKEWLATFSAPYGIDHVSMRRALVDARWLVRDTAGVAYRRNAGKPALPEADVEPARLLAEIQAERDARKRRQQGA
jgi:hypothetical protein